MLHPDEFVFYSFSEQAASTSSAAENVGTTATAATTTTATTVSVNASGSNELSNLANVISSPMENKSSVYGSGNGGGGGGSSTASSRDTSPCRELSPLVTNLKPPIIIRRGPRGFGFTVHTIRVYYGDTDFYTMHHLVMAVDETSSAYEAGLRPGDLITHVNGEPVQGLFHTQVLQLLLNNSHDENVTLRATPLEHTSIQSGGRKRDVLHSKLAKKSVSRQKKQRKDAEKKRKTSLFRRISTKRASAEIQQLTAAGGLPSPGAVTPSRSCQSFTMQGNNSRNDCSATNSPGTPPMRPTNFNRLSLSPLDNMNLAQSSSQSSSPSSSAPNTPTNLSNSNLVLGANPSHVYHHHHHHHQRPSTLHGLKHKLHTSVVANKGLHHSSSAGTGISTSNASITSNSSNRRKSVGHIPLSPLARTPSPSPLPASPTRSPSPLAFPIIVPGHQPGSSNTTQSYSPGCVLPSSSTSLSNNTICSGSGPCSSVSCMSNASGSGTITTVAGTKKTSFARPKSAEPSSPLLRRALSPDRLHPRSAGENKLSPLCCSSSGSGNNNNNNNNSSASIPSTANLINAHAASAVVGLKKQRTPNSNKMWHSPNAAQKSQPTSNQTDDVVNQEELMPIAEEKDSPVNANSGSFIAAISSEASNPTNEDASDETKQNTSTAAETANVENSSQVVNTKKAKNGINASIKTMTATATAASTAPTASTSNTTTTTTATATQKKHSK